MKDQRLEELIEKYVNGTSSIEEQLELQVWYDSKNNSDVIWQTGAADEEEVLRTRLFSSISKRTLELKPKQQKLWWRVGAAAAVVLVIGAGLVFYNNSRPDIGGDEIAYANDIGPGISSATLTLSDGKKILLSAAGNGELAREAGVSIIKTSGGQLVYEIKNTSEQSNKINTLSTANGETYQVRLPDGTVAWLNAASSISYPASFASLKTRNVQTTGEVYFDVAKDRSHPFIVETKRQEVEVLGTHFNINAYENEGNIRTTLLEGSVKIKGSSGKDGLLKPGQQAVVVEDGELKIAEADTELAVAWKNNKFMFESQQIKDIMRMVERWYDVKVVYENGVPDDRFTGTVSRFDNVSQVLRILEKSGGVHFKISEGNASGKGKIIYVLK